MHCALGPRVSRLLLWRAARNAVSREEWVLLNACADDYEDRLMLISESCAYARTLEFLPNLAQLRDALMTPLERGLVAP